MDNETGTPMAELIRKSIDEFIKRHKAAEKEEMKRPMMRKGTPRTMAEALAMGFKEKGGGGNFLNNDLTSCGGFEDLERPDGRSLRVPYTSRVSYGRPAVEVFPKA